MYAWIWRHIPFGTGRQVAGLGGLIGGASAALLWYQVFPAVEPSCRSTTCRWRPPTPAGSGAAGAPPSGDVDARRPTKWSRRPPPRPIPSLQS